MNDDLDLAPIDARAAAATTGPWTLHSRTRDIGDSELRIYSGASRDCVACVDKAEDGVFLVHARQDIDALLAKVRRLRAQAALYNVLLQIQEEEAYATSYQYYRQCSACKAVEKYSTSYVEYPIEPCEKCHEPAHIIAIVKLENRFEPESVEWGNKPATSDPPA